MNTWTVLKTFLKINYLIKYKLFRSLKDEDISEKQCPAANNIWRVCKINTMGDYYESLFKNKCFVIS